jgi:hypothetical protein
MVNGGRSADGFSTGRIQPKPRQPMHRPGFPSALRFAAIAYSVLNRTDEAQSMMRRLQSVDPDARVSQLRNWIPFQRSEDAALFIEGMRKAGMPE